MSLKAFHIFFIGIAILMAFGFAYWLMATFTTTGNMMLLIAAIVSFLCGIGLIFYGIHILKKLKHVSML